MAIKYKLKSPVRPDSNANLDDVLIIKKALVSAGHYKAPKHGLTPFPDAELFRGIQEFQRTSGLSVDGIVKPGGETERQLEDLFVRSPVFRCVHCGASHGGVYSPSVCSQCWDKGLR